MSGTYLSNPYQRPAEPRTFRGGCRRESGVGWRGGAFSGRALDPCQLRLQERCVSQSMYRRRRRWRTVASTLVLTLGSLAIPATALADGLIDPNFNGSGYAVGPLFSGQDNRVPMVIEPDGKIVVGGSSGGAMTLIRYNLDGSLDTSFGSGGVAQRQITGTPNGSPGTSGATAMTLDANGTILVAGFGGSQSMFVARYTAAGTYVNSVVCFAPHLIDYSARALAVKPNG